MRKKHQDEDGRVKKKEQINQFFVGDINMNYMAVFLCLLPAIAYFVENIRVRVIDTRKTGWEALESISIYFGFSALVSLALFLIPVARHSVLVAAMGWSPVHAIRIHILSGYFAFWLSMIHGLSYVPLWWHFVVFQPWYSFFGTSP